MLIVDDDAEIRSVLREMLVKQGFEVAEADDGPPALDHAATSPPAVVVLDVKMPQSDGLDVLLDLKRLQPHLPVIILTAHGDIPMAVEAMRRGAYDYVSKPFRQDDLVMSIRRAVERQALLTAVTGLASADDPGRLYEQMGPSRAVQNVVRQLRAVAGTGLTVLVQGETGTGKELVARAIHNLSDRRDRPFIALDCGAMPETLIESELFGHVRGAFTGADRAKDGHFRRAHTGTLFLDETGNLPAATQARLLRVLQERHILPLGASTPTPVDVRIIAASNLLLKEEMLAGRFRQDLYYRLSEFTIVLPPLRERVEDIPYLADRFVREASAEFGRRVSGVGDEPLQMLVRYAWPGNVRELRNVIRRAVVVARDVIRSEDLPPLGGEAAPPSRPAVEARPTSSLRQRAEAAVEAAEREAIREALHAAGGNKSEAARLLQTDYKTLHLKMRRYAISARDFTA